MEDAVRSKIRKVIRLMERKMKERKMRALIFLSHIFLFQGISDGI
jgi:hypothetical protein